MQAYLLYHKVNGISNANIILCRSFIVTSKFMILAELPTIIIPFFRIMIFVILWNSYIIANQLPKQYLIGYQYSWYLFTISQLNLFINLFLPILAIIQGFFVCDIINYKSSHSIPVIWLRIYFAKAKTTVVCAHFLPVLKVHTALDLYMWIMTSLLWLPFSFTYLLYPTNTVYT